MTPALTVPPEIERHPDPRQSDEVADHPAASLSLDPDLALARHTEKIETEATSADAMTIMVSTKIAIPGTSPRADMDRDTMIETIDLLRVGPVNPTMTTTRKRHTEVACNTRTTTIDAEINATAPAADLLIAKSESRSSMMNRSQMFAHRIPRRIEPQLARL